MRPFSRPPLVNAPASAFPCRGRRPDDPPRSLLCLPSVNSPTSAPHPAFSCRRRGTAKRWMRSNALPSAKPHLREKTPHPSAFSCHLLPPEKAYLYPARSCPLSPTSRQRTCIGFPPCRGRRPRRPASLSPAFRQRTLCLLLLEKGDRGAVDEECALFPTTLPSTHPRSSSRPFFIAVYLFSYCPHFSSFFSSFYSFCTKEREKYREN